MRIREKPSRVRLNLRNLEADTSILSIRIQARREWTGHATNTNTAFVVAYGVGESKTRWARGAFGGFVDVCCGACGGLVAAGDVEEGDVL